mmetsp:Transcript_84138/g.255339  ORF Transcript_84138/g.255339 Transcript_84138/m.255339 type:complete len:206 (-) Transcript_84138:1450-2067(-)
MPTSWKPGPWLPYFEGTQTCPVRTVNGSCRIASVTRASQSPADQRRPQRGERQQPLSRLCRAPPWWQLPTSVTERTGLPVAGESQASTLTISTTSPDTCMRFASLKGALHQYFLATKGRVLVTRSARVTLKGKRLLRASGSSSPQGNSSSMKSWLSGMPEAKSWNMSWRTRPAWKKSTSPAALWRMRSSHMLTARVSASRTPLVS